MVASRDGFQKTYDLRERVLPEDVDTRMPDDREMAGYLLRTMLRSHGFITPKEVTHLRRGKPIRAALMTLLDEALADGTLTVIRQPCGARAYVDPELLESRAAPASRRARLLSPFDNLVIHRDRVKSVFGLDYQIECYLSEKDRRYGYFSLPVVFRDRLVARADCKAHRSHERFEILHLHLEPEASPPDAALMSALRDAFRCFAEFNDCPDIVLTRATPTAAEKKTAPGDHGLTRRPRYATYSLYSTPTSCLGAPTGLCSPSTELTARSARYRRECPTCAGCAQPTSPRLRARARCEQR